MTHSIPRGFRFTGVYSGIKQDRNSYDLTLILTDQPVTAAGVYTQNQVVAAPVSIDRQRTPSKDVRAIVVNSGNANACTGQRGYDDAVQMTELVATECGLRSQQVLVMSTGIIGKPLPMERITEGIRAAAGQLGNDHDSLVAAARGIMTTDTVHKLASRVVQTSRGPLTIAGMSKGAGMIGPNMATLLAVVLTDATISPETAQRLLAEVTDNTFNCVSVEGHTSTNDSVVLLASGVASEQVDGVDLQTFQVALGEVCTELARAIADDGEGATHQIEIQVDGCATVDDARLIARTIANSPLVKTAVAGADPNWGRIVSAAGYAGPSFDPDRVALWINGTLLYERGVPQGFDANAVSRSMRDHRETRIRIRFGQGDLSARFWTSDLTVDYIHINADYHT